MTREEHLAEADRLLDSISRDRTKNLVELGSYFSDSGSAKSKAEDREKLEWVNLGMNRDIELVKAHVALAQELRHSEE